MGVHSNYRCFVLFLNMFLTKLIILNLIFSKGKILGSILRRARHDQCKHKLYSQRFSNTSLIRFIRKANTSEMARVSRAKTTTTKTNRERTS
jgi:hypothetical protein